jgi:uncharacterized phage-associated protein
MEMEYTAVVIAKWILAQIDRAAGDSITHLKLQKLVYYAQAWALVLLGRPLFTEDFQAWTHGPVVESVFNEYKSFRWEAIPEPADSVEMDAETETHLTEVLEVYGDFSAKHLEKMTHSEAPWKDARGDLPAEARSNAIITKKSMIEYYSNLLEEVDGE